MNDESTTDSGEQPVSAGRARRTSVLVTALVAVLAVALVVASLGYFHEKSKADDAAADQGNAKAALSAATAVAHDFTTYSHETLDADFARTRVRLTAGFQEKYDQTTKQLTTTLTQYKATSTSKVGEAAVVSATDNKAVVIAFIDQTISNSTDKQPTTDRIRMKVSLVKIGGSWKADGLDLL